MSIRRALPAVATFLLAFCLPARGQEAMQILKVNPELGTTEPHLPAINIWASPSIFVQAADPKKDVRFAVQGPDGNPKDEDFSRTAIIINFSRKKAGNGVEVTSNHSGIWTVKTKRRTAIAVRARVYENGAATSDQLFPIQIESKPAGVEFSAGFAVLTDVESRSYTLEPVSDPAGGETNLIVKAGEKTYDSSYRASVFVHYVPYFADWSAMSFGVSTDIPVSNLSLLLGASFRLKTLPVANDGFVTLGAAFTPTRRLRAGLENEAVPVGTDIASLYETKYGLTFFAAVTFGFLGGEERFKGVYGSAEQGGAPAGSPQAPAPRAVIQQAPPPAQQPQ